MVVVLVVLVVLVLRAEQSCDLKDRSALQPNLEETEFRGRYMDVIWGEVQNGAPGVHPETRRATKRPPKGSSWHLAFKFLLGNISRHHTTKLYQPPPTTRP